MDFSFVEKANLTSMWSAPISGINGQNALVGLNFHQENNSYYVFDTTKQNTRRNLKGNNRSYIGSHTMTKLRDISFRERDV